MNNLENKNADSYFKLKRSSWISVFLISMIIFIIRFLTHPEEYADFNGYVLLLDYIAINNIGFWQYGDLFSWGMLGAFREYSNSSYSAVVMGNFYVSVVYVIFICFAVSHYNLSWQSVILIFATFGPILAFVTIRATPAYFLVLFAALEAGKGRIRSLPICLMAALFHSSALLAFLPIMASLAQSRIPIVDRMFRSGGTGFFIGLLVVVPFILFRDVMSEIMSGVLDVGGASFSRFSVYLADTKDASSDTVASIFQQIYFIVGSFALLLGTFRAGRSQGSIQGYLTTSYGIFLVMSADPPSAFRQSLFWMIPLIAIFPWQNYSMRGFGSILIIPLAIVLFWYGFSEVLI